MADLLVERLTGQATADTTVEVQLLIGEDSLFGGGNQPAHLRDGGPIPAPAAREMIRRAAKVWLRRLHTRDGKLVAMDSRRRIFTAGLREFLIVRDQVCRTPWCGAPIRHADHVTPAAQGGPTSDRNGDGLCEACNYVREAPDWTARADLTPDGAGTIVEITTPTGHRYLSQPPDPPGTGPPTGCGAPDPPGTGDTGDDAARNHAMQRLVRALGKAA
jgi:hypothetical protein